MLKNYSRAKKIDNNEWVYGYYVYDKNENRHYIFTGELSYYPVDNGHAPIRFFKHYEVRGETANCLVREEESPSMNVFAADIIEDTKTHKKYIIAYSANQSFLCYENWRACDDNSGVATIGEGIAFSELFEPVVVGNLYDNKELRYGGEYGRN